MFPQFYFLPTIFTTNPLYEQKLNEIRKILSSINSIVDVVVVSGSIDSIKLGEELFESDSRKMKMFVQGLMRDRVVDDKNVNALKFREQQVKRYSKVYSNFEKYLQSEQSKQQEQYPQTQKSLVEFTQRIKQLKQQLVHYTHNLFQQNSKIILIANNQILNHLGATDYHQNGQPVNGLHLNQGDMDLVSLVVDQEESIKQLRKTETMFCS